ncbi:MAG TPA: 2-oxo acid dehydrogenase subunit E2 [Vicinamibacterales bacterium]|nr:2-oxo acid dehydrogenase subunit E2 [Vicinamibacterales bacterium]
MAKDFNVPELGENVKNGDVVRVLVKPGDRIAKDQPVIELETDKATIEVPSSVSGTVKDVAVKPGDKVNVGQLILRVEETDGAGAAAGREAAHEEGDRPQGAAKGAEGREERTPAASASAGRRREGAASAAEAAGRQRDDRPKPQPAGAPEDGGLSQEATPNRAPAAAERPRPRAAEPAEAQGPQATEEARESQEPRKVVDISRGARPPAAASAVEAAEDAAPVPAAPSVRRLARELNIDIHRVKGSGPGGRVSEEDVKAFVRSRSARTGGEVAVPDFSKWGEVERKPMSNVRRVTAERLTAAWAAPHVTQHDRADITELEALRHRYSSRAEAAGAKLTITAILVKVLAEAMRRFPQFNASLDLEAEEIVYRKYVSVGVAVDTERGLLVPVIRDADRKTIVELAVEVASAAKKARDRKLAPEDMTGGGMSVTNLGGIGGTAFTPIINAPEVAILGLSRSEIQPVWRPAHGTADQAAGQFEPRLMLPLSLSYDHRVIDGADAARFLRWVCEALEQPLLLAL